MLILCMIFYIVHRGEYHLGKEITDYCKEYERANSVKVKSLHVLLMDKGVVVLFEKSPEDVSGVYILNSPPKKKGGEKCAKS